MLKVSPSMGKTCLKYVSYLLLFGFSIILITSFMIAFFHPSKRVILDINYFGEANVEFIMFVILIPVILIGFYFELKSWMVKKRV